MDPYGSIYACYFDAKRNPTLSGDGKIYAMINVVENYLPEKTFDEIYASVYQLPWKLHKQMNPAAHDEHQFAFIQDYHDDRFFDYYRKRESIAEILGKTIMLPYLQSNKISANILRVRTNLYIKTSDEPREGGYHIDIADPPKNCFTLLLYLEKSNGATQFKESGNIITSERNKAVIFPCCLEHQTIYQTDVLYRTNININFAVLNG